MINYEVIASGSSGNCVRVENLLFDCGVPYSRLKHCLYYVDALLITPGGVKHGRLLAVGVFLNLHFPLVHFLVLRDDV